MTTESPCIGMCWNTDLDKGICLGCFRTLEEVSDWRDMSDEQREKVLGVLEMRRKKVGERPTRRRGRRARRKT